MGILSCPGDKFLSEPTMALRGSKLTYTSTTHVILESLTLKKFSLYVLSILAILLLPETYSLLCVSSINFLTSVDLLYVPAHCLVFFKFIWDANLPEPTNLKAILFQP